MRTCLSYFTRHPTFVAGLYSRKAPIIRLEMPATRLLLISNKIVQPILFQWRHKRFWRNACACIFLASRAPYAALLRKRKKKWNSRTLVFWVCCQGKIMAPISIRNCNIKNKLNPERAFKTLYSRNAPAAIYLEMPFRGLPANSFWSVVINSFDATHAHIFFCFAHTLRKTIR